MQKQSTVSEKAGMNLNRGQLIRRGNIDITQWNGERTVGCYLGNGRFGAIMSSTGLNLSPEQQNDPTKNFSHFRHMNHWGRFRVNSPYTNEETCADYLLPFFSLYWMEEHRNIGKYRQLHDLYDGVLSTYFEPEDGGSFQLTEWFDSVNRNMFVLTIDVSGNTASENAICLGVHTSINPCRFLCRREYAQRVLVQKASTGYKIAVSCEETVNLSRTEMYIFSNMSAEETDHGLAFRLQKGKNILMISVDEPLRADTWEQSLMRTKEKNHAVWDSIGWLEYESDEMHTMWVRSMAYLLTSYDADSPMIQPANCMGINGFPYNFVPDIANIAPALMMLGRSDIPKHWVEKFYREIDDMRAYARRLWPEAEGVFPPWELNFGPIEGYHAPRVPVIFCYEAHNTGYLAKLAMDALSHSADEKWSKKYVYPLIDECAKFFIKFCFKEDDGFWHLKWYPCMGRDEAGGVNKDDYLCTLITAKYTFQAAVRLGLDHKKEYEKVLTEGLAFKPLLCERGTLHTCRGADDFGKQKHPVQLEGLASFPTENHPLKEEVAAYNLRYDITANAREPRFHGWTLAQLLMVGTNLKNYDEWKKDWDLIRPSDNTDENWIQLYETGSVYRYAFYTATHGMVLLSLIRNVVNDYWGKLEIGNCVSKDEIISFGDIQTGLGVSVSGKIEYGKASGIIKAYRDTTFEFQNDMITLKRNETKAFYFSV